jgi:hypothetical protein
MNTTIPTVHNTTAQLEALVKSTESAIAQLLALVESGAIPSESAASALESLAWQLAQAKDQLATR